MTPEMQHIGYRPVEYATIDPPMRSPVEQQKKAVRVTFVTIWLMIAGCLAAAWWWL